jgi:hypothetical protein
MSMLATFETHASITVTATPLHAVSDASQQNEPYQQNNNSSPFTEQEAPFFVKPDSENAKIQEQSQSLGISLINATNGSNQLDGQSSANISATPIAETSLAPSLAPTIQIPSPKPLQESNYQPKVDSNSSQTAVSPAEKKKTKTRSNQHLTKGQRSLRKKSEN